jgi:splicing factor 3B subunit 1
MTGLAFDTDLYTTDRFQGFTKEVVEQEEDDDNGVGGLGGSQRRSHPSSRFHPEPSSMDMDNSEQELWARKREQEGSGRVNTRISDRQSDYQKGAQRLQLSPGRDDPFADQTPARGFANTMRQQQLMQEKAELERKLLKQQQEEAERATAMAAQKAASAPDAASGLKRKREGRRFDAAPSETEHKMASEWDQTDATPAMPRDAMTPGATPGRGSRWDNATPSRPSDATPARRNRWDNATPSGAATDATPGPWDQTPKASGWDQTPKAGGGVGATPTPSGKPRKSRWDDPTPGGGGVMSGATPLAPGFTPVGTGINMPTPSPSMMGTYGAVPMTPEQEQRMKWERELEERNRHLTDEDLDEMFKNMPGFKVLDPPADYNPQRPLKGVMATPTPMTAMGGFHIQSTPSREEYGIGATPSETNLPFIAPEDEKFFKELLAPVDEDQLSPDEAKRLKIMRLLLKIKKGTPPQRKTALRQITDKAREFGAGPLFDQILPLLMSPSLEDQERHLFVKVIDRILYKLDDLIRPYVHKILVVIEPLLIDEDYYARVEGREIISNLAKAAGLPTMIATMRPDIDNLDEYVRNTTARAFAVVASALGIPALLPFLKAVCQSKKSWQARHTGIKIVQQIAILMGCAVLPHLKHMVDLIEHGLVDENQKVRTITALALAALAEAAYPYGIESFDTVLRPLWKGIRQHRGKGLAAFLKAIGFIIPLMDAKSANYFTKEVMVILIREFTSPDEEMKKIVLKVRTKKMMNVVIDDDAPGDDDEAGGDDRRR